MKGVSVLLKKTMHYPQGFGKFRRRRCIDFYKALGEELGE